MSCRFRRSLPVQTVDATLPNQLTAQQVSKGPRDDESPNKGHSRRSLGMAGFCFLVRLFSSRPDAPAFRTHKSLSNFDWVCGGFRFSSFVMGYAQAPEITPPRTSIRGNKPLFRFFGVV